MQKMSILSRLPVLLSTFVLSAIPFSGNAQALPAEKSTKSSEDAPTVAGQEETPSSDSVSSNIEDEDASSPKNAPADAEKKETPSKEETPSEGAPKAAEGEDEEIPVNLDNEEEISLDDLDALDEENNQEQVMKGEQDGVGGGHPLGGGNRKLPKFKLFFDFLVEYEFETNKFQFTKDHAYVVLELDAAKWLTFRTDVSVSPEFFELNFHIGRSIELNIGKVLIPFGQNTWHHLIGGRVDKESLFLPTLWADYGISFKHRVFDGEYVSIEYSLYGVNGFQDSSDDYDNPFPSQNAGSLEDNNQMKGIGARPSLYIDPIKATIGSSWYFDAWDKDNDAKMLLYGVDLDLGYGFIPAPGLKNLRLRAEAAWGEIQLPGQNYYNGIMKYGSRRAGYNFEASFKVLPFLTLRYREGYINTDSRFRDSGDLRVHEPSVITRVGPVVFYVTAQFLDPVAKDSEISRDEYSSLFLRVLFRY